MKPPLIYLIAGEASGDALGAGLMRSLPFEPPYFEKEGLKTTFVGHPVLWQTCKSEPSLFRAPLHWRRYSAAAGTARQSYR